MNVVTLVALLLALGATSATAAARLAPGDHDLGLADGAPKRGKSAPARRFIVRIPPAARTGAPLPVLLAFHGGGGNAAGFKKYAGLDRIADREGVVAPRARDDAC